MYHTGGSESSKSECCSEDQSSVDSSDEVSMSMCVYVAHTNTHVHT